MSVRADMTATVVSNPVKLYSTPDALFGNETKTLKTIKINYVDNKDFPKWFKASNYNPGWIKREDLTDISGDIEGGKNFRNAPGLLRYKIKNTISGVYLRPDKNSSKSKASFSVGDEVYIDDIKGDWYHINGYGWVVSSDLNIKSVSSSNSNSDFITSVDTEEMEYTSKQLEKDYQTQLYEANLTALQEALGESDLSLSEDDLSDTLLVNNLNGIYGIPYQFMASVDQRLGDDSSLGRKYSEKIISKMPLLCITPGKPDFMSNFSKNEQKGILAKLLDKDGSDSDISDIITKNERYFTFTFEYDEYFKYVNGLCQAGARFLNIEDLRVSIGDGEGKLSEFDWGLALNSKLKATFSGQEFIGFYMDSTDSVTESFNNNTTKSTLESMTDSASELGREMGFLMGNLAGKKAEIIDQSALDSTLDSIDKIFGKYKNTGAGSILKNIADNFATVATGAKLLFPEIWADSEFSRNFSIDIKLRTPDGDALSWYLNIYVPLCHLIALAAGHQTDYVNGYYSPFLIRANYKGLFNVDMGIITSLNITKGREAAWNIDGLPTEINVSMDIKDLYGMLAIVPASEPKTFVTNNILMDYISNTCGININQMDLIRSVEIYYILTKNRVINLPNTFQRKFQDTVDKYAKNIYDKVLNDFLI